MKERLYRTTEKETGILCWYLARIAWRQVYYSFDSGDTWHSSKREAFQQAHSGGRLDLVKVVQNGKA